MPNTLCASGPDRRVGRHQRPEGVAARRAGELDAGRADRRSAACGPPSASSPSPPVPARLNRPRPSMKNGRFSLKNTGKRLFTSTSKASLSTWLKSGLMVASSVTVDVMPYFTLAPKSAFDRDALPAGCPTGARLVARHGGARDDLEQQRLMQFAETRAARGSRRPIHRRPSPATTTTCRWRLLWRKNSTPIRTSGPPRKRMLCERQPHFDGVAVGVDAAGALPHPVHRGVLVAALQRVHLDAARVDEHVVGDLSRRGSNRGSRPPSRRSTRCRGG